MHIFKHHAGAKFLVMLKIKHHFALRKNPNDAYKTGLSVDFLAFRSYLFESEASTISVLSPFFEILAKP